MAYHGGIGDGKEYTVTTESTALDDTIIMDEFGTPWTPIIKFRTTHEITIRWEKATGDIGELEIFCKDEETGEKKRVGKVDGRANEFKVSGLKTQTKYRFKVVPVHGDHRASLKNKRATVISPTECTTSKSKDTQTRLSSTLPSMSNPEHSTGEDRLHTQKMAALAKTLTDIKLPPDPREEKMTRIEKMLLEEEGTIKTENSADLEDLRAFTTVRPPPLTESNAPRMIGTLDVNDITSNSVSLSWSPAIGQIDNYCVSHRSHGGVESDDFYLNPSEETYNITDLEPSTQYSVCVKPVCWDTGKTGHALSTNFVTESTAKSSQVITSSTDQGTRKPTNHSTGEDRLHTGKLNALAQTLSVPSSSLSSDPRQEKMTRIEKMLIKDESSSKPKSHDDPEPHPTCSGIQSGSFESPDDPRMVGTLEVGEITSSSVSLSWERALGDFDNYCISHRSPGKKETEVIYLDPGEENYMMKNLESNTQYTVSVKPIRWKPEQIGEPITTHLVTAYEIPKQTGERQKRGKRKLGKRNAEDKQKSKIEEEGPVIDGVIRTKNITDRSLTIKWDPAIGRFKGYGIYLSHGDGRERKLDSVPANVHEYDLTDLKPGVPYRVMVKPICKDPSLCCTGVSVNIVTDGKYRDRKILEKFITETRDDTDFSFKVELEREEPIIEQCAELYILAGENDIDTLRYRPDVSFTENPETLNIGGPTREYFTLLIDSIAGGSTADENVAFLFEGQEDHKVPVHDQVALDKNLFEIIGRMVQHSILWGGPGLAGLAQSVKDYVTHGHELMISLNINDIPDMDIREKLQKVMDCSDDNLKELATDPIVLEMMVNAGYGNRLINKDRKQVAIQDILLYNVIRKRKAELVQFRSGMNCLSITKLLQQNEKITDLIFPKQEEAKPRFCSVCPLLKFGQGQTKCQTDTKKYFLKYLQECERRQEGIDVDHKRVTLAKVLQFITGCTVLPPKSYGRILVEYQAKGLPKTNTCFKEIFIPTSYVNYNDFRNAMDYAISHCDGFGRT
ncbi:tenascin-N-like [Glandiceps talaboti]